MEHELSVCWLPLEEMLREGEVMEEVPFDVEDEDPYKSEPCLATHGHLPRYHSQTTATVVRPEADQPVWQQGDH